MSSAFMKPQKLSPELAALVGVNDVPRTDVVKKIWDYIKANNLQDPNCRREIACDEKMKSVFGSDRINMFEIAKGINKHIIKDVKKEAIKEEAPPVIEPVIEPVKEE